MKKHRREELELPWGRAENAHYEYLFNRLRQPIWVRYPCGTVHKCDGDWLSGKERQLFYGA